VIARDRVIEKPLYPTGAQVAQDGFAIIPNVLSAQEIQQLTFKLEKLRIAPQPRRCTPFTQQS
jgi:hypothetical protein